jgi:hypothetical protein
MHRLDLPLDKVKPIPEEWQDNATLDAITAEIEEVLGWKNLLGGTRKNLKLLLPIIQKHLTTKG